MAHLLCMWQNLWNSTNNYLKCLSWLKQYQAEYSKKTLAYIMLLEYIKQQRVGKHCYNLLTCSFSVTPPPLSLSLPPPFLSLVSRCCQDSCSLTVSLLALSVILTPHPLFLSVLMFINNNPVCEREKESILHAVLTSALSLGVSEFLCQVESVSPAQWGLNSSVLSSKGWSRADVFIRMWKTTY